MSGRILLDLDEREYHAHSAFSSTQARKLLESPARYRWDRDHPQAGRQTFDVGTAVHTKVLGTGAGTVEYPAEHVTVSGAVSTKAATVAWAEEQRAAGLTPIAPAQAARVNGMAEAVLAHPTARELLERVGNSETSVFATDPDTGVDIRARFDRLALDDPNPIGIDLKTTGKSASVDGFMRTVATYGYEVQQEFYRHALELNGVPRIPFVFIVVETEAPHLVGVRQLDIEWEQMGAAKVRRAIDLHAACTASGIWPGYEPDVQLISPPAWAVYAHEDEYGPLYEEIAI